MDSGFGERVETFFSPSMGYHAGRRTTDHRTKTIRLITFNDFQRPKMTSYDFRGASSIKFHTIQPFIVYRLY